MSHKLQRRLSNRLWSGRTGRRVPAGDPCLERSGAGRPRVPLPRGIRSRRDRTGVSGLDAGGRSDRRRRRIRPDGLAVNPAEQAVGHVYVGESRRRYELETDGRCDSRHSACRGCGNQFGMARPINNATMMLVDSRELAYASAYERRNAFIGGGSLASRPRGPGWNVTQGGCGGIWCRAYDFVSVDAELCGGWRGRVGSQSRKWQASQAGGTQ